RVLDDPVDRVHARARSVTAGHIEVFGRVASWRDLDRDPLSGLRVDSQAPVSEVDLTALGIDPKGPWEVGRCAHVLALGLAARLAPDCAAEMRGAYQSTLAMLAGYPIGRGLHWASPLEASIRAIHLLAGFDLLGGSAGVGPVATRELAHLLLCQGRYIKS